MEHLQMTHVAYRDIPNALRDLGAGRIHVMVGSVATISPQLQAGTVRLVALTNSERSAIAPLVPTAIEAGYPSLTVDGAVGILRLARDTERASQSHCRRHSPRNVGSHARRAARRDGANRGRRNHGGICRSNRAATSQVTDIARIAESPKMYVFPNAAPQAAARLRALADIFDPGTMRHLEARGVGHGWSCLEVGGGLGTMTRWLATRVGQRGQVLTTDIDTRHLDSMHLPNVEVRRHDIVSDTLPEAAFDLACTRLVLEHRLGAGPSARAHGRAR